MSTEGIIMVSVTHLFFPPSKLFAILYRLSDRYLNLKIIL